MNVILCTTPLQVLIAEQIAKKTQGDFFGFYLPYGNHQKHQYYFKKLQSFCKKSSFIELKNQTWQQRFATLNQIKNTLKQHNIWQQAIENIYLASIDVLFLQYIISKVTFKQLYTFDDGTANIFPNSSYFNPIKKSLPQRIFKQLIGIRYPDIPSILAVSKKHYTIFPNENNIIENTEVVSLFSINTENHHVVSTTKKILLGQGLDDFIGETAYRQLVENMVQRFDIGYFVPHPREKQTFDDILQIVVTEKIIEAYLLDELAQNPQIQYEIYTFFSTAVFLLKDFPRTQIYLVSNDILNHQFNHAYQFLQNYGFSVIHLDDKDKEC